MRFWITALLLFFFAKAAAQSSAVIQFVPKMQGDHLYLNTPYIFNDDTIVISALKFYITELAYFKDDSLVHTSHKQAHLIDIAAPTSLEIVENKTFDFNNLRFKIGVDSSTSVAGVFEGDLDPTNGMYWTWQSGYINFKLEGTAKKCPARLHKFYWHIGGYLQPLNMQRAVVCKVANNKRATILLQIEELFGSVDMATVHKIMSPSEQAMQFADLMPSIFKPIE